MTDYAYEPIEAGTPIPPEWLAQKPDPYPGLDEPAPLGATTPSRGFPYPLSSDPVSQGAAAIEALARSVDTRVGAMMAVRQYVAIATYGTITFDWEDADDWNGIVIPNHQLSLPAGAGHYHVMANVIFTGATGTGATWAALELWDWSQGYIRQLARADGGMNGGICLAASVVAGAADQRTINLQCGASATGYGPYFTSSATVVRVS